MDLIAAEPGTCLLLVRHGETEWNRDQRVQGHHDVDLSERGIAQTRRLAEWLADEPPDAVYTSDLLRSRRTAEILAAGRLPVVEEPRFREGRFGVFEGMTAQEIEAKYPAEYRAWREDAVRNRPPGGETLEDLSARCMAALRDLLPAQGGRRVAVVAHGGPVRAMVCGLLGLSLELYPKLRVENTSVTRILFTARGAILAGFNDTAHLRATAAVPGHQGWEEK
jgi:broad specificity phosphatase PhoE